LINNTIRKILDVLYFPLVSAKLVLLLLVEIFMRVLYPNFSQGKRIKIIKYIDWEDVEEPCKGDTPA